MTPHNQNTGANTSPRALVIGMGNDLRQDDAAGIIVVRVLASRGLSNVDFVEYPGDGAGLMSIWCGYDLVFVADASRSNAPAGTITRIDAAMREVAQDFFHYSSHAFGLAEAINTAKCLGELPEHLIVYAVEGKQFGFAIEPTMAVGAAAIEVARMIEEELRAFAHRRPIYA